MRLSDWKDRKTHWVRTHTESKSFVSLIYDAQTRRAIVTVWYYGSWKIRTMHYPPDTLPRQKMAASALLVDIMRNPR